MTSWTDASHVLIPYGASRLHPRVLEALPGADGSIELKCAIPHVIVTPNARRPLRLNDACYDFSGQTAPTGGSATPDPMALLRTRIENLCELWGQPARLFVLRYFDFITAQVDRHRAELERRLEPFGGLYVYQDWVYSAPAPLPRAWLHAPRIRGTPPSLETFVFADFAFWIGDNAIAVYVSGFETPTAASRERLARLHTAGVQVHDIPGELIRSDGERGLRERLPAQFLRFWEQEAFPSGPFRNSMLGKIEEL